VKSKPKIDWDTVELVGELVPTSISESITRPVVAVPTRPAWPHPPPPPSSSPFGDPRTKQRTKQILSGASAKARSLAPTHTHTQLRKLLPAGLEMLIYGWWLVAAAIESDRDVSRGVEIASHAIIVTSRRLTA
jgi:hypothetical protein